jgi:hypothetical protein
MTRLALIGPEGQVLLGDSRAELVSQLHWITWDLTSRRLIIHGKPDTVSFSDEWKPDELWMELNKRAIEIASRYRWKLFQEVW